MATNQCAFRDKIRSPDDYLNLDATDVHMVPYVTGGLGRLMQLIQEDRVPQLHDYGYHTDNNGYFSPKDSCIMVLRYKMKKILDSKGQSAVIVLAEDSFRDNSLVVIKVLHTEFYRLGVQESHVLWRLAKTDPLNHSHTLRILTTFTFDSHYCLVFEPLLPDPLTTIFQEFPSHKVMANIRKVGLRLLATLGFLHQQNLIHTDLKPENILLKYENYLDSVHVVDFGNTINYIHSEVSLYYKDFALQTPLYRAPEVMFGVPFGPEIDIWSLGCIFADLYLGKPLLYGETTEDILKQMYELLGPFPAKLFRRGKFYKNLKQFTTNVDQENTSSKIFEHLQCADYLFADLLSGMLKYDPGERLTASEAAQHPFFASHFPVAFLLPSNNGTKSQLSVPLTKKAYPYTPNIAAGIRKGQPSSLDLLRIGTSDVNPVNDLDETTILKPSPRYKMKGQNLTILDEPTRLFPSDFETSGAMTPKAHGQHAKPVQSDISVVKNVISERKDKFSDNVKEKMSSLLKAIRQEQVLVESNLEQRFENEIQSPKGNRGVYCYRPTESVRPVPKYGAYKENVLNRSEGAESFKEPQFTKSPNLEKKSGPYLEDTFIVPDRKGPLHRLRRSTEKHKQSDSNMEECNDEKREIDKIFSCQSYAKYNRTDPLRNELVGKIKSPKSKTGSNNIFKLTCSPKIKAKISKSLASEKDVKAPVSPGYTPSRTMSRSKWIDQDSENTTQSNFDIELGENMSGGKTISTLDREKLFECKSDAKFRDRKIKTENRKGVGSDDEAFKTTHKLSKSYSPESRKRSYTNDMSDDDMINILSPVAHGGSSCKRQKYLGESSGKIHERVHSMERKECKEMELDVNDSSQPNVSPKPNSYSRNDRGNHIVANESVHLYESNQHSFSDDGSGPTREELNWRKVTNNSGDLKGIETSSEPFAKSKSKKRLSQGMPTPIEKQPHVFHNISDHAATDSPEIVYKTIGHHKVNRNILVRERLSLESDEFHNFNKGTRPHSGDMNSLTRMNSKVSKYQVRDFKGKTTNRKHGDKYADYSDELNDYRKSSSRKCHMEIDKLPDKFSFLGTPASDRKLEGGFAERIAQRQSKLKKKARKSLNFQGEEEVSDESFDYDNDSDKDSVDLSCGYRMSSNHTAREYRQFGQIPMKFERKNDQRFVEHLPRSGQVINKDRSQRKNATNKDTRYLNRDATFVLDFESPLRPNHTK